MLHLILWQSLKEVESIIFVLAEFETKMKVDLTPLEKQRRERLS